MWEGQSEKDKKDRELVLKNTKKKKKKTEPTIGAQFASNEGEAWTAPVRLYRGEYYPMWGGAGGWAHDF